MLTYLPTYYLPDLPSINLMRGQKIVTRWTSQRDRYRREFKGEAEDKRSGAGASKKRRSPFFEMLDFLRNVMELRHTITNISEIEERRGIQAQRIPSKRKRWEFTKLSRVPNNLRLTNCRQIKNQQQQEPRRKDVCLFDLFEPPRQ